MEALSDILLVNRYCIQSRDFHEKTLRSNNSLKNALSSQEQREVDASISLSHTCAEAYSSLEILSERIETAKGFLCQLNSFKPFVSQVKSTSHLITKSVNVLPVDSLVELITVVQSFEDLNYQISKMFQRILLLRQIREDTFFFVKSTCVEILKSQAFALELEKKRIKLVLAFANQISVTMKDYIEIIKFMQAKWSISYSFLNKISDYFRVSDSTYHFAEVINFKSQRCYDLDQQIIKRFYLLLTFAQKLSFQQNVIQTLPSIVSPEVIRTESIALSTIGFDSEQIKSYLNHACNSLIESCSHFLSFQDLKLKSTDHLSFMKTELLSLHQQFLPYINLGDGKEKILQNFPSCVPILVIPRLLKSYSSQNVTVELAAVRLISYKTILADLNKRKSSLTNKRQTLHDQREKIFFNRFLQLKYCFLNNFQQTVINDLEAELKSKDKLFQQHLMEQREKCYALKNLYETLTMKNNSMKRKREMPPISHQMKKLSARMRLQLRKTKNDKKSKSIHFK